jgi:uncharacterized protein YbaA (DUF1428 family)/uncharacterized tellurite resistance protein B-like protein
MLKTLNDLLDRLLPPPAQAGTEATEHVLQLATAVMLVEVMRADASFHAGEREAVRAALRDKFALSADEAQRLAELAEVAARDATDLFSFTSRINERFDMPQKLRMVEHMWRVAYADGHLGDARAPGGPCRIGYASVRRQGGRRPQESAPTGQPNRSQGMPYIDGFVIAVPTANKQKFIDHARHFDALFIELGAIRVIESWGDDVPDGKVTDFRRAVQATAEETVAFSWVEWPDKATRDAGMKKMMEDPRMDPSTPGNPPMPFDGKRMIFGGFEQVVEVKA